MMSVARTRSGSALVSAGRSGSRKGKSDELKKLARANSNARLNGNSATSVARSSGGRNQLRRTGSLSAGRSSSRRLGTQVGQSQGKRVPTGIGAKLLNALWRGNNDTNKQAQARSGGGSGGSRRGTGNGSAGSRSSKKSGKVSRKSGASVGGGKSSNSNAKSSSKRGRSTKQSRSGTSGTKQSGVNNKALKAALADAARSDHMLNYERSSGPEQYNMVDA